MTRAKDRGFVSPLWVAPKSGHDWICEDTKRAVAWLKSFVSKHEMDGRLDKCAETYLTNRESWENGAAVELFDKRDEIAWFIFQAQTYAEGREFWAPDESARIVPFIQKVGKELHHLKAVEGVEERVERTMTSERRQPEGGIFELLVAAAYKRHKWSSVEFVPETPGRGRTPDLYVSQSRRKWAIECKRVLRSQYARTEEAWGKRLSQKVHDLSEERGFPVVVDVHFFEELHEFHEEYLRERVEDLLSPKLPITAFDGRARVRIRRPEWELVRNVMRTDYVHIGSSRMMEILAGGHQHDMSHSLRARCRRAHDKPSYADTIYHASLVNWASLSPKARGKKAAHFKKKVADAEAQLPSDRPGAVHIGIDSVGHAGVDQLRHVRNHFISREFENAGSRLRWAYGNYFQLEVTTREGESCALEETMAPYRIGSSRTKQPLSDHLLVADDDELYVGAHWL